MSAFDRRLTHSEFYGRGCAIVDLRPSSEPFSNCIYESLCCINMPNEAQSERAWFSLLYSESSDKQLERGRQEGSCTQVQLGPHCNVQHVTYIAAQSRHTPSFSAVLDRILHDKVSMQLTILMCGSISDKLAILGLARHC